MTNRPLTLVQLRPQARASTLGPPSTLAGALQRMGFVQPDPIRAPARAQDLILRHRVRGYRAGDLDRAFQRLELEEDFLYAHGFMPVETRHLLHLRADPADEAWLHRPDTLAAAVLEFVRATGPTHPRDLETRFGRDRAINGWGGFSKATTRALESLPHYGLLRIARRQDGIRIYAAAPEPLPLLEGAERARQAVLLVARILAPISPPSLGAVLALMARRNPGLGPLAPVVRDLLKVGALKQDVVEGDRYLWPGGTAEGCHQAVPRDVRILAPFDPLVWDRRRFEHLWGWAYRFEAYTPPAKRQFGYYAMPLLWGDAVIGWANLAQVEGQLQVALGFAGSAPRSQAFQRALDAELTRFRRFFACPDKQPLPS
ncbi:DNA glycosylase AlkZ-like family protein [Pseudoroseomonas globiformis]|uniref:DNA glycosylase AlkZ-like family protein n=1 Tax=Teichococcus globiformis TaxID=2307229 RepID=A0ABV7G7E3_9PROT